MDGPDGSYSIVIASRISARFLVLTAGTFLLAALLVPATTTRPASAAPAVVSAVHAAAAPTPALQVTIVARQCAEYTDVTANRARNNIQESLRDLGADTLYSGGEPISVAKENQGQPTCTPIPNWTFTLGSGYSTGNPSNLSKVTGVNGSATTLASTPELDRYGNATGNDVAGAVTITLTPTQAGLAGQPNKLWIQGGTPSQQLNGRGDEFGFAALRCAIDNLNGDNVEWIAYPQGTTHVFCYAYYVQPPPQSATIVVKKQSVDGSNTPLPVPTNVSFDFQGNVSYNDQPIQGAFTVPVASGQSSGTTTFIRGATDTSSGGTAWNFQELDPAGTGWAFVDVQCNSPGGSVAVVSGRTVTITKLVAGDTVTCTYRDQPEVSGPLTLVKVTEGGVGGPFGFTITPPSGPVINPPEVTTTEVDVPELVAQGTGLPLGHYSVSETAPADTSAGTWAMTDVACSGVTNLDVGASSFTGDVTGTGNEAFCVVVNTFTPKASITIKKVSAGGTLTADFFVTEVDPVTGDPGDSFSQSATTTEPNTPATATGDDLTGLPLGTYQIYESGDPDLITADGVWQLTSLDCGAIVGGGGVQVTLTAETPDVTCTFTDTLVPFGTLTVSKVVAGDPSLRTDPVTIAVECTDGQSFTLTGAAGQAGPFTVSAPTGFLDPTDCTVTETATGAALATDVATSWSAAVGSITSTGTGLSASVTAELGKDAVVTFTDVYTAAPAIAPKFTG